jgi:hypothetical protein
VLQVFPHLQAWLLLLCPLLPIQAWVLMHQLTNMKEQAWARELAQVPEQEQEQ